jgi:hypothetical protein
MPARGPRASAQQEKYVKLFFASAFDVTSEQMAVAIGQDFISAPDAAAYAAVRGRLNNIWRTMRTKTFGSKAYLTDLVQHIVELRTFQAIVFNMAREARLLQFGPEQETDTEKDERLRVQKEYNDAVDEHLERLSESRATAVERAKADLDLLQDRTKPARPRELKAARAALAHTEDEDGNWKPALEEKYSSREEIPSRQTLYEYTNTAGRQKFWEQEWTLDIGAAVLWEARQVLDIPATLENNEEFYLASFVVFAIETWRFCGTAPPEDEAIMREFNAAHPNANTRMQDEKDHSTYVYPNMAEVKLHFFDDQEGLGLLRLPAGSEVKSSKKRQKEASLPSRYSFGNKKKKF